MTTTKKRVPLLPKRHYNWGLLPADGLAAALHWDKLVAPDTTIWPKEPELAGKAKRDTQKKRDIAGSESGTTAAEMG